MNTFSQELDKILDAYRNATDELHDIDTSKHEESKQAITKLVEERVIGKNESAEGNIYSTEEGRQLWRHQEDRKAFRNELRTEQRKRLHEGGGDAINR